MMMTRLGLATVVLVLVSASDLLAQVPAAAGTSTLTVGQRMPAAPVTQRTGRVQPIVLDDPSTSYCVSPVAAASRQVPLPRGDSTYLPPRERDPLRVVPTASQLRPLPVQQGYVDRGQPVAQTQFASYTRPAPSAPIVPTVGMGNRAPVLPLTATSLRDGDPSYLTPYATAPYSSSDYPYGTSTSLPPTTTTTWSPVAACGSGACAAGPARVEVYRPVTCCPPAVPEGYVVGKGLIGQPKLYRPGQPVLNFLRYLSL